jgi:hypothetical protein
LIDLQFGNQIAMINNEITVKKMKKKKIK